jgi:hypothetical protein
MFKFIGVLVAAYTVYAVFQGEVFAKSGPGGRTVTRDKNGTYFWVVVAIYASLAVALVVVF